MLRRSLDTRTIVDDTRQHEVTRGKRPENIRHTAKPDGCEKRPSTCVTTSLFANTDNAAVHISLFRFVCHLCVCVILLYTSSPLSSFLALTWDAHVSERIYRYSKLLSILIEELRATKVGEREVGRNLERGGVFYSK